MIVSPAAMVDRAMDSRFGRNVCIVNKVGVALPVTEAKTPVIDFVYVDIPTLRK